MVVVKLHKLCSQVKFGVDCLRGIDHFSGWIFKCSSHSHQLPTVEGGERGLVTLHNTFFQWVNTDYFVFRIHYTSSSCDDQLSQIAVRSLSESFS